MSALNVSELLQSKVSVKQAVHLEDGVLDIGRLMVVDNLPANLPMDGNAAAINELLREQARDSVQYLVNSVIKLDHITIKGSVFVTLPKPELILPRSRRLPEPKPLTKWQEFAAAKGIVKKKHDRLKYDDATDTYKPRFGRGKAMDETQHAIIELPSKIDPDFDLQDHFQNRLDEKKARVEKNTAQFMRNTQKNMKGVLNKQILMTRKSTASLGKFDKRIKNEPTIKGPNVGKKRHFAPVIESNTSGGTEKSNMLNIMDKILKPKTVLSTQNVVAHNARKIVKFTKKDKKKVAKK